MTIRPKQFARIGEFHLEEAILDVMLEGKHKSQRCDQSGKKARTASEGWELTDEEFMSRRDDVELG